MKTLVTATASFAIVAITTFAAAVLSQADTLRRVTCPGWPCCHRHRHPDRRTGMPRLPAHKCQAEARPVPGERQEADLRRRRFSDFHPGQHRSCLDVGLLCRVRPERQIPGCRTAGEVPELLIGRPSTDRKAALCAAFRVGAADDDCIHPCDVSSPRAGRHWKSCRFKAIYGREMQFWTFHPATTRNA